MQTNGVASDFAAQASSLHAEFGFVLVVLSLVLVPLTVLTVRRIFPGRNVVFARWGFSHVVLALALGLALLWISTHVWPVDADAVDIRIELVRMAAVLAAVVALIVRFAEKQEPEGWRALGIWRGRHGRAVAAGLAAYAISLPGIFGLGLLWPWLLERLGSPFEPQALMASYRALAPDQVVWVLVLGIAVLPLLEELVFRVFLQPLLVQNFSEKGGVLLTSFAFAALHGASAFLPVFGLSLVLGGIMLRTQRLAAVWAVHALHNAVVFAGLSAIAQQDGSAWFGIR